MSKKKEGIGCPPAKWGSAAFCSHPHTHRGWSSCPHCPGPAPGCGPLGPQTGRASGTSTGPWRRREGVAGGARRFCVCVSLSFAVCTSTVSLSRAGWAVWEKGTGVCQGVHALQMARHAGSAVCVTPGGVFCFWNWCVTRRFSFVVLFSPLSLPPHAHTPSGTQPWRTRPAPHCPASWPSCPSSRRGRCACGVRMRQGDAVRRTGAAAAASPSIERRRPHPCAALPPRHARTHTHAPLSCTGHRRRVIPRIPDLPARRDRVPQARARVSFPLFFRCGWGVATGGALVGGGAPYGGRPARREAR